MSFKSVLAKPFVWIGKEVKAASEWVPKLVVLVDDVKADAKTLLPELGQVVDSVASVAKTAVKDSAADITAAENLVTAITAAATQGLGNIASDEGVVSAFEGFIKQVSTTSNYADLMSAIKDLVTNYDTLGASVKTALTKLEQDA